MDQSRASIWITKEILTQQERDVNDYFDNFYGKNRGGFYDKAQDGIELILQGCSYLRNNEMPIENEDWNNFDQAIRTFALYHFHRTTFTFKSVFNLVRSGYYTESAVLLRNILETFVRLRFIYNSEKIEYINQAFYGYSGYKGKRFSTIYKDQFDSIAPNLYSYYQRLCDIAHGALDSNIPKLEKTEDVVQMDIGIVFKERFSAFIVNQFNCYLLAHLKFMLVVFPEIRVNWPDFYQNKFKNTIDHLELAFVQMSKSDKSKKWSSTIKSLIP